MGSGEPGAPLHLRIKAFHVDITRNEARRPGLKLEDIASMVVPRQSYLRRIDPDGKRPIEDVKKEVRGMEEVVKGMEEVVQGMARSGVGGGGCWVAFEGVWGCLGLG